MPEPLRGKEAHTSWVKGDRYVFTSEDVQSAVEFYKKYRSNKELLFDEHKEIYVKYSKEWINIHCFPHNIENDELYNSWLFDYCFGDVIEYVQTISS